jgi:hypothetical protein
VAAVASVPSAIGRHAPAYLGAALRVEGVTAVDTHALARVAGASYNTARRYWARVQDLARVAAWAFEHASRPATDLDRLFPGRL